MKPSKDKLLGVLAITGMATCCLLPLFLMSSTAAIFSFIQPEYAGLAILVLIAGSLIYHGRRRSRRTELKYPDSAG